MRGNITRRGKSSWRLKGTSNKGPFHQSWLAPDRRVVVGGGAARALLSAPYTVAGPFHATQRRLTPRNQLKRAQPPSARAVPVG